METALQNLLGNLATSGLSGVQLVASDDRQGLTRAIAALLPAPAGRDPDLTAFAAFPTEYRRRIWSNNQQSRSTGRSAGARA